MSSTPSIINAKPRCATAAPVASSLMRAVWTRRNALEVSANAEARNSSRYCTPRPPSAAAVTVAVTARPRDSHTRRPHCFQDDTRQPENGPMPSSSSNSTYSGKLDAL